MLTTRYDAFLLQLCMYACHLFQSGPVYSDTAAALRVDLAFVCVGSFLEATHRTKQAPCLARFFNERKTTAVLAV